MKCIGIKRLLVSGTWLLFLLFNHNISYSQSSIDSILKRLDPQKFAASISKKADKLEEKLVTKSMKVLDGMQRQEEKIYKKMLNGEDSLIAKANLSELNNKYSALKDKLKNPAVISTVKTYLPKLDSLNTSLRFLTESGVGGKVKDALAKTTSLQDKFQQAEEIKKFIKERKEQLKAQLEKLGMVKQLKAVSKKYYYYAAQIKEYKEILKDPKKIEKKALELLSKIKFFQDFMRKNSMLASLFRMQPDNPNDPAYLASLAGLQTRSQVNNLIQQQIGSVGPNGMQQFQNSMNTAQNQMNELKEKILRQGSGGQLGSGSSDDVMPEGFKPNDQKTKSFFKRLELGTNIQTQKSTNYFPTTSDVAVSVGYKLNDKSIIGIGGGTKVGLGRGWNNIRFSYEGISLRSFIDWRLKGNLWISGGYERNFKTSFSNVSQLQGMSGWQSSGLIGLSKAVPVKSKFFKKTKLQLLWDFMAQEQIPRTQSFIFRINYNFK